MKMLRPNEEKGFTLIELLIGIAISGIVVTAFYGLYVAQSKSYTTQDQVAEMQQNARVAIDMIVRDVRMAGFGKPAVAVNGFLNAITAGNNVNNSTDQITVVAAYDEVSTLAANAPFGAANVTLQSAADAGEFDTGTKRYLCIGGTSQSDCYTVTGIIGNQLAINPSLTRDYGSGCAVFLVKAITYAIDWTDPNCPRLNRNENLGGGAQALAENIEDLQLVYQDANGNWFHNPPVPGDIRSVRVNVLARTTHQDPDAASFNQPQLEDHIANLNGPDGYRRRLLTTVVKARNMGL
jgi:type IV pilus assembly protein PilW